VTRESFDGAESGFTWLPIYEFSSETSGFDEFREGCRMVLGLGTDLIEIARMQQTLDRFGERFMEKVFTEGEIAYCRRKKHAAESFAARFAAKEAAAKALGTGISHGISWKEIEVRREPGERPTLHLSGRAAQRAMTMGVSNIQVSLTHSRDLAMAVVIAED
jgi:holo-[acyl-carrier protein] synthase